MLYLRMRANLADEQLQVKMYFRSMFIAALIEAVSRSLAFQVYSELQHYFP